MLLTILGLALLAVCTAYYIFRNARIIRCMNEIHGPPGWPAIGNMLSFVVSREKLWHIYRDWDKKYYPVYKLWLLQLPMINMCDPENAEKLLSNSQNLEKSFIYDYFRPWLGDGLLNSTGEKWRKRRKILTQAFHFNILQKYHEIMVENGEKLIQSMKTDEDTVKNLSNLVTDHALNVICETAMGTCLHGKEEKQVKYRKAVHDIANSIIFRFSRPWLSSSWIFNLTDEGRKHNEAVKTLHDFSRNIIMERKAFHEKTGGRLFEQLNTNGNATQQTYNDENFVYKKKRLAMLDLLIAAQRDGGQIDDEGIREEVDTFIFEGHDTTAMGLLFSLLLIAEHKDVQNRIRQEVEEILASSNGVMGFAEVQRMHYLERVIKECLRLYPSVPYIMRKITEDLQLKDSVIVEGTFISLHIYEINRNSHYWPKAEEFDPDRFLPERSQGRHPFTYIPFSAGPRNCIGQKFAMMEIKTLAAQLVQNFYLEPVEYAHEVPVLLDIVLRPTRPVYLKFIPIEE